MIKATHGTIGRYAVTLASHVIAALTQGLFVALLARALGVSLFGQYALAASLTMFAIAATELGTGTTILRLAAERQPVATAAFIFRWRSTSSAIIIALLVTVGFAVATTIAEALLISAAVTFVVGESLADLAVGYNQSQRRSIVAMSSLLSRRVVAIAPLGFGLGVPQATVALAGGGVYATILFAYFCASRKAPVGLASYLREKRGIIGLNLLKSLGHTETAVVGGAGGIQLAGLFGGAIRLQNPAFLTITSLTQVLLPDLADQGTDEVRRRSFLRARRWVLAIATAVACSALAAGPITDLFLGSEFADAAPIVAAVLIGAAMTTVAQFYMSWFYATDVPSGLTAATGATILLGLLGLVVGAVTAGPVGVAVGLAVSRGMGMLAVLIAWHRIVGRNTSYEK